MKTYSSIKIANMQLVPFNTKVEIICNFLILEENDNKVILYKSISYNNCSIESIDFINKIIYIKHYDESRQLPFNELVIFDNVISRSSSIVDYFKDINS